MTKIIITPSNSNILLPVPDKCIGKKIEVLMYDVDEVTPQQASHSTVLKPSELRGFLSKDTAQAMQQYVQQSRNEWDILPTATF